jgi:capsular polysaccharide biosynthesis protein
MAHDLETPERSLEDVDFDYDERGRPSGPSLGDAVRRYWLLVAISALLFCAIGVAAGYARHPKYTATTQLSVSNLNVAAPGALAAYTTASQALASSYSRSVTATAVLAPVARRFHTSVGVLSGMVTAAPIPQSPLFRIRVTSPARADARRLSNAIADSLITYVGKNTTAHDQVRNIYKRYAQASLTYNRAVSAENDATKHNDQSPSSVNEDRVNRARAAADTARLRLDALRTLYDNARQGEVSTAQVSVLSAAGGALSDRKNKTETLGFAGLIAGLVVGCALAVLRSRRRRV